MLNQSSDDHISMHKNKSQKTSWLYQDILSLICAVMGTYFLIALSTYTHDDSAWLSISTQVTQNDAGPLGAWLADVLWSILGMGSWCVVLIFHYVWVGMILNRLRKKMPEKLSVNYVRIASFFVCLTSLCGLLTVYEITYNEGILMGGGLVGQWVFLILFPILSTHGTLLLLTLCSLIGFMLWTQVSGSYLLEKSWLAGKLLYKMLRVSISYAFKVLNQCRLFLWKYLKAYYKTDPIDAMPRQSESIKHKTPLTLSTTQAKTPWLDASSISSDLLDAPKNQSFMMRSKLEQKNLGDLLESKLRDFGIQANVVGTVLGPVVTQFELELAPGLKASKVSSLAKDLARSLTVPAVRVVEVIPGKSVVGIEIPNPDRQTICFRELIESSEFVEATSPVALALGHNISGQVVIADLSKMPHLLVAGTTGSGKSVGINAMILSILYKATPEQVRLIMIDPKMLELSVYEEVPHLLTPVVTDMTKASKALNWCVLEMEKRYKIMTLLGVRNLQSYNEQVIEAQKKGVPLTVEINEGETLVLEVLPLIVVLIDEFADMIMVIGKKVETLIARIAQKARASGIHLILATQRPSVDIVTGLIKANIPSRISFQVSSKIDSRTILDQSGAEQLLGAGDMLYLPQGSSNVMRIHGAFVSDDEVHRVVHEWKKHAGDLIKKDVLSEDLSSDESDCFIKNEDQNDALYDEAVVFILESKRVSILGLQRRFKIGYGRAVDLLDAMEKKGVISENKGSGKSREILIKNR